MTALGSLCTGYGGLDLAVEAVLGARPAWLAELDPNASKVCETRFPGVPNLHDITAVDWAAVEPIDVLTAGYPCQPFSHAGRRKGTDDPRHLWPHIARAISVLRPRLVVLENVAGHVSLGFDAVLGDLAELGFDAEWCVVRASDVGACHRRARLFVVATDTDRAAPGPPANAHGGRLVRGQEQDFGPIEPGQPAPRRHDPDGLGLAVHWGDYGPAIRRHEHLAGRPAPAPTDDRGRLAPRFVEWMMCLPDGWVTDVDLSRAQALKILGNGVVPPQAAYAIAHLLEREAVAA